MTSCDQTPLAEGVGEPEPQSDWQGGGTPPPHDPPRVLHSFSHLALPPLPAPRPRSATPPSGDLAEFAVPVADLPPAVLTWIKENPKAAQRAARAACEFAALAHLPTPRIASSAWGAALARFVAERVRPADCGRSLGTSELLDEFKAQAGAYSAGALPTDQTLLRALAAIVEALHGKRRCTRLPSPAGKLRRGWRGLALLPLPPLQTGE